MRLSTRLNLASWLDVERRPILILANVLGLFTFLGALALSGPLTRDDHGLTVADRTLCTVFKGPVCLDVAKLTPIEQAQLEFVTLACEGGVTEECISPSFRDVAYRTSDRGGLVRAACRGGFDPACPLVEDFALLTATARSFEINEVRRHCEAGLWKACTVLGFLLTNGIGETSAESEATSYFRLACENGERMGCDRLANIAQD